jgi:hypothetical protein
MAGLIKLVQTVPVASMLNMKKDIINTIRRVFLSNKKTRDSFREFGGFVSLASLMFAIVDSKLSRIFFPLNL